MKKEKYELIEGNLDYLLDLLFLNQHQVIVRSEGVVVGMFEYEKLRRFINTKGYQYVEVVSKSYGYELEVPLSIEQ